MLAGGEKSAAESGSQREADSDTRAGKDRKSFPALSFDSRPWASAERQLPRSEVGPTVLRIGPYRFFFYSNEGNEPAHLPVQRDRALAKFWLTPASLASSTGFSAQELGQVWRLIQQNTGNLKEAWDEFFGGSNRASR